MDRDGRVNSLINQRYLIVRPLGEGGMGFVYLARDTALGDRTLALKILRPEALDPLAVERFKEEFRSMARLRHPNLAEVYDFETVAGSGERFLTMEHIDGRDLGAFRWPALREGFDDLAVQCLRALDYIHARGLLHNDIKPHNIMVSPPFQVKILDFGLAQRRADSRSPGLSGTVHYIAPERLKGEGPDGRSDLYSLGVVLYELVTGSLPYQGEDVGQVITAILQGRLRPPREINPDIPARLEAFVLALLAHDRAGRPASSSAALDLLQHGRVGVRQRERVAAHGYAVRIGERRGDVVQHRGDVGRIHAEKSGLVVGVSRRVPQSAVEQTGGIVVNRAGLREVSREVDRIGSCGRWQSGHVLASTCEEVSLPRGRSIVEMSRPCLQFASSAISIRQLSDTDKNISRLNRTACSTTNSVDRVPGGCACSRNDVLARARLATRSHAGARRA